MIRVLYSKGWLLTILTLLSLAAAGQAPSNPGFVLQGTVKGIDSGTVRIVSSTGKKKFDSAVIREGKFTLRGKVDVPERMVFNISPGNWNFKAFVEDTLLFLLVDTAGARHYENAREKWSLIPYVEQTGSEITNAYTQYNHETRLAYYIKYISSIQRQVSAGQGGKNSDIQLNKETDSVSKLLSASQKAWITRFINLHPSSIAGVYMLYEYYQLSHDLPPSSLDSTMKNFSGLATTSIYYKELESITSKWRNTQPGRLAPDFTLPDQNNAAFTLSSLRGKYVLLDFWASWCVPCRKAIPLWKDVYATYKHAGFTIVSVSDDSHWNDWIAALKKEHMPWIQVVDKFPDPDKPAYVSELYGIKSIPFYMLLDKEGKIIISSMDDKVVKETIKKLLHEGFKGF